MKIRFFQTLEGRFGVVVNNGSAANIRARHFRGRAINKAGNLARWSNPAQFLDDRRFATDVLPALLVAREESHRPTVSVEIEFNEYVGWTAATDYQDPAWSYWDTVPVVNEDGDPDGVEEVIQNDVQVMPQSFEWRRLRRGVKAEFVTDGSPAPMTRKVTVIARFKERDWGTLVVLYSIRPGMVMPEFMVWNRGDIEVDESYQLMFWDWECDGDDPADPNYPYARQTDVFHRRNLLTGEVIPATEDEDFDDVDD